MSFVSFGCRKFLVLSNISFKKIFIKFFYILYIFYIFEPREDEINDKNYIAANLREIDKGIRTIGKYKLCFDKQIPIITIIKCTLYSILYSVQVLTDKQE